MVEKFDYNAFFNELEESLTLMPHNIDKRIYDAPNIHNKILRQITIERNKLQKLEKKYDKIFAEKYQYYRYDYETNLGSKDVAIFYIKNDTEFLKINDEFNNQKLLVETLERWMKKAQNTAYEIKNIVEFLKWSSGK